MKRTILFTLITITLNSCLFKSDEPNDLLKLDIENATKIAYSDKVLIYKTIKIASKVIGTKDTNNIELKELLNNMNAIHSLKLNASSNYSVVDLFNIYRDYKKIQKSIPNINEDNYRTLSETFLADSNKVSSEIKLDRKILHNYEHGLLSILAFCARGTGEDITLYESLHTHSDYIIDFETKSLVQFIQGLHYLEKKFYYLSERDFSKNIAFLELENFPMPVTKVILGEDSLDEIAFQKNYLALNYLIRFLTRDKMSRDIDKKNGIEDLKKFVEITKTLKNEDELTLNAELLLCIKIKDYSKAIIIVEKLKSKNNLSSSQIKEYDKILKLLKANEESNLVEENINLFNIIFSEVIINIQKIDMSELIRKANMEKSLSIIKEFDNITSIKKALEENENTDKIKSGAESLFNSIKEGIK